MKKQLLILGLNVLLALAVNAQVNAPQVKDEQARVRMAIPLLTYDTLNRFQSPRAEACYQLMKGACETSFYLPELSFDGLPELDKAVLEAQKKLLQKVLQNPPTWSELIEQERAYLIWKDRMTSRRSKYTKP